MYVYERKNIPPTPTNQPTNQPTNLSPDRESSYNGERDRNVVVQRGNNQDILSLSSKRWRKRMDVCMHVCVCVCVYMYKCVYV